MQIFHRGVLKLKYFSQDLETLKTYEGVTANPSLILSVVLFLCFVVAVVAFFFILWLI